MARILTHPVAFRVTAQQHRELSDLRATFPEAQWGEMFRWLFQQDAVRDVIEERLREAMPDPDPVFGVEASLPRGDR